MLFIYWVICISCLISKIYVQSFNHCLTNCKKVTSLTSVAQRVLFVVAYVFIYCSDQCTRLLSCSIAVHRNVCFLFIVLISFQSRFSQTKYITQGPTNMNKCLMVYSRFENCVFPALRCGPAGQGFAPGNTMFYSD
jgi:hypothetical protein